MRPPVREEMITGLREAMDRSTTGPVAHDEMRRLIVLLERRTPEADAEVMRIARSVPETELADLLDRMLAAEARGLGVARLALIDQIRETSKDIAARTGSMTLSSQMLQAAALLERNTEEGDRGALMIARALPVDLSIASEGMLGTREGLAHWIELMQRTERMDALLASGEVESDTPVILLDAGVVEGTGMINDGMTRGRRG